MNTISSTCTHRGAQLANGWIDTINGQSCVRCPYHAWAFSGDGTVKDIPVQPEGGYPRRPLQQSFETTIEDGKMWLFWGRPQIPVEERPPVPGSRSDAMVCSYATAVLFYAYCIYSVLAFVSDSVNVQTLRTVGVAQPATSERCST